MAMMIHADTAESSSLALLCTLPIPNVVDRAFHSLSENVTWSFCMDRVEGKARSRGDDVVKASLSHLTDKLLLLFSPCLYPGWGLYTSISWPLISGSLLIILCE